MGSEGQITSVDGDAAAFALRVSGWLVPDVRRHLFFIAWACTVPVHVRYVMHLLRLSAVYAEMAEESPSGYVSEAALRAAAADILFGAVAADCREANAKVRSAELLPAGGAWSEPRSVAFAGDGSVCAVGADTSRAEVLALVAAGDSAGDLRAAYLAGLEQARAFERMHAAPAAVDRGVPSPAQPFGRAEGLPRTANSHGRPEGVDKDIIILESDLEVDATAACEKEVVVLTDSSEDGGTRPTRKRQSRLTDKMRRGVVVARAGKNDTLPAESASAHHLDRSNQNPGTNLGRPSSFPRNTVLINVYDIVGMNHILYPLGLGAHHTGVEVYGREVAFGRAPDGTGVFETPPRVSPPHIFREQLVLGQTPFTSEEVCNLVEEFKSNMREWSGASYHLIKRNCNDFSEAFARRLMPPDVRAAQRGQIPCQYDSDDRENVQLSSGAVVELPVLVPTWTNRLARSAARWLPKSIIEKLEELDGRPQEN